jgi:CubicO group peptidase (beta-lactamase class C family)
LNAAQYQADFNSEAGQGYRLVSVSGYEVNGRVNYATVWEKSQGPAWEAKNGMTAQQYQTELNAHAQAGFHLVQVNGYTVQGTDYYAAIWDRSTVVPWQASHGLSASQYQADFNKWTSQGYRLRHLSGYGAPGHEEFAAIWEKVAGPAWVARNGLTAAQFQGEFNTLDAQGYHPVRVAGYPAGGETHYVGIWEQGASVPWQAHHGLSAPDYQQTFTDLTRQGFRPIVVSGYETPNGPEFAAIWLNFYYSESQLQAIDKTVSDLMASSKAPGLSLAISTHGRLVFAKGYGLADQGAGTPVTTSSLFRIASVTKPFTATGILKLFEAHHFKLTDHVFGPGSILGTEFTSHPKDARVNDITLEQVLSHTAGLWPNDANDPMFQNYGMSRAQLITSTLEGRMLASKPGTTYAYSNFGFLVLGRVIEKVTGQSYESWMKANVLSPLGIHDMRIAGSTQGDRAAGEVVYYSSNGDPYGVDVARMDSHGGWIATPVDLVRFLVHLDGFPGPADILSPNSETLMTTPTAPSIAAGFPYGFGLAINTAGNNWWHNGSLPGTQSILVRTPGDMVWAAVVNSRDNSPDIDGMMWKINGEITSWPEIDLF